MTTKKQTRERLERQRQIHLADSKISGLKAQERDRLRREAAMAKSEAAEMERIDAKRNAQMEKDRRAGMNAVASAKVDA